MVLIFDQDRATVSGPSPVYVSFHVVCNRTLTRGSKIKRSDSRFIRLKVLHFERTRLAWERWRLELMLERTATSEDCRRSPPSVRLVKCLIVRSTY
jgi:hypothetical protein